WNWKTGKCLKTLTLILSWITCLKNISKDKIVVGAKDNVIRLVALSTETIVKSSPSNNSFNKNITYSKKYGFLTKKMDKTIIQWDSKTISSIALITPEKKKEYDLFNQFFSNNELTNYPFELQPLAEFFLVILNKNKWQEYFSTSKKTRFYNKKLVNDILDFLKAQLVNYCKEKNNKFIDDKKGIYINNAIILQTITENMIAKKNLKIRLRNLTNNIKQWIIFLEQHLKRLNNVSR
ncbi:MAG: hypothetical protein U9O98_05850, partial [Asgard group archaeon]|nr:hypothetical protein [Asgard group archaeon]